MRRIGRCAGILTSLEMSLFSSTQGNGTEFRADYISFEKSHLQLVFRGFPLVTESASCENWCLKGQEA